MINMQLFVYKPLRFMFGYFGPWSVGLAVALGMVSGLTPMLSLHNLVIVFILLIFKINVIVFIVSFLLFSTVGVFFAPYFHEIGVSVLTFSGLESIWTTLYNINIMRLARFNNSVVMGSLCVSMLLFIPVCLFCHSIVKHFQQRLNALAQRWQWLGNPNPKEVRQDV